MNPPTDQELQAALKEYAESVSDYTDAENSAREHISNLNELHLRTRTKELSLLGAFGRRLLAMSPEGQTEIYSAHVQKRLNEQPPADLPLTEQGLAEIEASGHGNESGDEWEALITQARQCIAERRENESLKREVGELRGALGAHKKGTDNLVEEYKKLEHQLTAAQREVGELREKLDILLPTMESLADMSKGADIRGVATNALIQVEALRSAPSVAPTEKPMQFDSDGEPYYSAEKPTQDAGKVDAENLIAWLDEHHANVFYVQGRGDNPSKWNVFTQKYGCLSEPRTLRETLVAAQTQRLPTEGAKQ